MDLADELLADFEESEDVTDEPGDNVGDDEGDDGDDGEQGGHKKKKKQKTDDKMDFGENGDDDDDDDEDDKEAADDGMDTGGLNIDLEALAKANDIRSIAKLHNSKHLLETLKKVQEFLDKPLNKDFSGPVENHPEYSLVVTANKLLVDIENEIVVVHKFIRDQYQEKFPELESLVPNAMDYVRTVKLIGNETELTKVNLGSVLQPATVMVVAVSGSTSDGKPLAPEKLTKVIEACDMALSLDETKNKLLMYVETRMSFIAPNLTNICGSVVAAKIIGVAGGLTALSRMPACNVLVLGAAKKTLQGFSAQLMKAHRGFVYLTDIVQGTPPDFQKKAAKFIADKCSLAARVDSFHENIHGEIGQRLRSDIIKKLDKAQEAAPAKQVKALPIPLEKSRKRRGGKRARKAKERLGMTEMRKAANRLEFGVEEEEAYFGGSSMGLGKLTGAQREMSGKVRAIAASNKNKVSLTKKQQQQLKSYSGPGSSSMSGLASSLVFTPVQGLELSNPDAVKQQQKLKDADKWFGASAFRTPMAPSSASTPK